MIDSNRHENRIGSLQAQICFISNIPEIPRLKEFVQLTYFKEQYFEKLLSDGEARVRQNFHILIKSIFVTYKDIQDSEYINQSNLKMIQAIIDAAGIENISDQIYEIIDFCVQSKNRYVREQIQDLIQSILKLYNKDNLKGIQKLATHIGSGLADNWSQVRFSASKAARAVYELVKDVEEFRDLIDKILVPRICFNRHYMAEGIKIYNQDTWKFIMGDQGKQNLLKLSNEVVEFYNSQLFSENFQVREVSTECFDELFIHVAPLDKEAFKPYLNQILGNLISRVVDPQWQVRRGVFLTIGNIASVYDEELKDYDQIENVCFLLFKHLSENVPTVREAASITLGQLLGKGFELKEKLTNYLKENLLKAKQQQPLKAQSSIPYGIKFDIEEAKNSSSEMSIEDRIKQQEELEKAKQEQLVDPGFLRPAELWEFSDGSIYLMREISKHSKIIGQDFQKLLQSLPDLGFLDQFTEASLLKENLFQSLVEIILNFGKSQFRPYLELFIEPAFRTAKDDRYNCQYPAQEFVMTLVKVYGQSIVRAVIESYDDRFLGDFQNIIERENKSHPLQGRYPGFNQQYPR
ncbi:uncharacterized protein loc100889564 [Stylonychia lemnae]|uniref:Uncharacterized protein loc100889564 n=1 Tax=Stylonychia lemnae TaxID=5949 RepID=A0A078AZC4_STYLE|nr:uncharacterized protein loc100889564 [Stylonychia lemnae]|eukprot:CDW87499.1 uncharacterized protein loc100889564 [Stylonychia lemnae]